MTSFPAPVGYAPGYSWIGAPATFNGTNNMTGGDSCKLTILIFDDLSIPVPISCRKGSSQNGD